jgi:hypothetical protein
MKYSNAKLFVAVLALLPALAQADCLSSVAKATVKHVTHGLNRNSAISYDAYPKLISTENEDKIEPTFTYEVAVYASVNDGASSDELPAAYYIVKATGTSARCAIQTIKLKD